MNRGSSEQPALQEDRSLPGRESWWRSFFDDAYADYGLTDADPQLPDRIAEFVIKSLELSPGEVVFDQCCGRGRIGLPLARRGMRVIGVDLSQTYIESAQRQAAAESLPCVFHCADAFEFVAPEPCDAAINWFSSFGYCQDDRQNIRMLQRAYESLKPGGRFVIDFQNLPRVFSQYRESHVDRPAHTGVQGLVVLHEYTPDFARGMFDSCFTFLYPDGRRLEKRFSVRMLMPHELIGMLRACGFEDFKLSGWINGEAFSVRSRRCIITARKSQ